MLKNIKDERLDRLIIRKDFNYQYNIELIEFLKKNINEQQDLIKTLNFIDRLDFIHPGLNSNEYMIHPLRLAVILYKIDNNVNINTIIIALLHNIFEVTKIKEEEFLLLYDRELMDALKILTVNRQIEHDIVYKEEYYSKIFNHSKELAIVKAIDKFDNLFLLCLNPNKKIREKYLIDIEKFIYPIIKKYIPSVFIYYKNLVQDCKETGFLDKNKSLKIYNKNYS